MSNYKLLSLSRGIVYVGLQSSLAALTVAPMALQCRKKPEAAAFTTSSENGKQTAQLPLMVKQNATLLNCSFFLLHNYPSLQQPIQSQLSQSH